MCKIEKELNRANQVKLQENETKHTKQREGIESKQSKNGL